MVDLAQRVRSAFGPHGACGVAVVGTMSVYRPVSSLHAGVGGNGSAGHAGTFATAAPQHQRSQQHHVASHSGHPAAAIRSCGRFVLVLQSSVLRVS